MYELCVCLYVCFGSICESGQAELGSETREWVTRGAAGDGCVIPALF